MMRLDVNIRRLIFAFYDECTEEDLDGYIQQSKIDILIVLKHMRSRILQCDTPPMLDAFHMSCFSGNLDQVKLCLHFLAIKDLDTSSGFCLACGNGHTTVVRYLVSCLPIDSLRADNCYAFFLACNNNHLDIAQLLTCVLSVDDIRVAFDVSKPTAYWRGFSNDPLLSSCWKGHIDILRLLLRFLTLEDLCKNNNMAFLYACGSGHLRIVQILAKRITAKHLYKDRTIFFKHACETGHLKIVKYLATLFSPHDLSAIKDDVFDIVDDCAFADIQQFLNSFFCSRFKKQT